MTVSSNTRVDLREIVKDILDKDCRSRIGDCRKHMILTGKRTDPNELGKSYNMCFLCHENDELATEITEVIKAQKGYVDT
jgi:hypothetical protein